MAAQHKLVRIQDLVELGMFWPVGESGQREFAGKVEAALDRMAGDGWELVAPYGGGSGSYFIFREMSQRP